MKQTQPLVQTTYLTQPFGGNEDKENMIDISFPDDTPLKASQVNPAVLTPLYLPKQ
jgi:hypothetical protein